MHLEKRIKICYPAFSVYWFLVGNYFVAKLSFDASYPSLMRAPYFFMIIYMYYNSMRRHFSFRSLFPLSVGTRSSVHASNDTDYLTKNKFSRKSRRKKFSSNLHYGIMLKLPAFSFSFRLRPIYFDQNAYF